MVSHGRITLLEEKANQLLFKFTKYSLKMEWLLVVLSPTNKG